MTNVSNASINILRGISDSNIKPQERDWKYDTSIWNAADRQADKEENKTAITVLLEDFAELTNKFNDRGNSCITSSDAKKYGFFEKLFNECDNIFKTDEARQTIRKNGAFTQHDIYEQAMRSTGCLEYADENDDVVQAALNFAKADIAAIEKSYNMAYADKGAVGNGVLSRDEINSYYQEIVPGTVSSSMYEMDLGEDYSTRSSITAEEYASYVMAVDGLTEDGFSIDNIDGKILFEEAEIASGMDIEELQKAAKQVYNLYFSK